MTCLCFIAESFEGASPDGICARMCKVCGQLLGLGRVLWAPHHSTILRCSIHARRNVLRFHAAIRASREWTAWKRLVPFSPPPRGRAASKLKPGYKELDSSDLFDRR
jgi:hypothetical protein